MLARERVYKCLRSPIPGRSVAVHRRQSDSHTYYSGLHTCGSVWHCPVCAAKISERRRVELQAAISAMRQQGGFASLLTLTVPHYAYTDIHHLLGMVQYLTERFWSGRSTAAKQIPGYVGQVRALEVTHGVNSWHPHLHILLFTLDDPKDCSEALYALWSRLILDSGLGTPNHHALRLEDGTEAAKYAGKWGLAEELTKAHLKQGRISEHRTPWAILADSFAGDVSSGPLFQEFAGAFKGRFQLRWSNGLRELLELRSERSDEEIAASVSAEDPFWVLATKQWNFIVRNNLRGQALEVFRFGGFDDLTELLCRYGFS